MNIINNQTLTIIWLTVLVGVLVACGPSQEDVDKLISDALSAQDAKTTANMESAISDALSAQDAKTTANTESAISDALSTQDAKTTASIETSISDIETMVFEVALSSDDAIKKLKEELLIYSINSSQAIVVSELTNNDLNDVNAKLEAAISKINSNADLKLSIYDANREMELLKSAIENQEKEINEKIEGWFGVVYDQYLVTEEAICEVAYWLDVTRVFLALYTVHDQSGQFTFEEIEQYWEPVILKSKWNEERRQSPCIVEEDFWRIELQDSVLLNAID